jgi:TnpA family transposase
VIFVRMLALHLLQSSLAFIFTQLLQAVLSGRGRDWTHRILTSTDSVRQR